MVLLINLIPWLIVAGATVCGFYFNTKKVWVWMFGIMIATAVLYPKVQPSYMPKGDITRTALPEFEASKAEIEDRNRKPVPSEVRQAQQEEEYRKGANK